MKALVEQMLAHLQAGRRIVLVRVIRNSGSAPRGAGAAMLVGEGGHLFGTVGGGTVEYKALQQAADVLGQGGHIVREYALRNREAADLGMVCGGDMTLLFQRIGTEHEQLLRAMADRIASREPAYLVTDLDTGGMTLSDVRPKEANTFAQPIIERGRAYVFGAGHVALALVPLLSGAGFAVEVLDDRADFANRARFPDAQSVQVIDFAQLGDIPVASDDAVIIMTRGHGHDMTVLAQILTTQARYIGMMGSRAKRAYVYDQLREQGFSDDDFARIHSPVGLEIGAETPFEIAVSIVAQLIRLYATRE